MYNLLSTLPGYLFMGLGALSILRLAQKVWNFYFTPLRKVPEAPRASFLLGVFPQLRKEAYMEPHKRWWKALGPDVKMIHYTVIMGRSSLLILDKEIVREILTAPAGVSDCRFNKNHNIVQNILGDGLVSLEGTDWFRHRRIVNPSFNTRVLKENLGTYVPELVTRLMECWKRAEGREFDVGFQFGALTLDIIGHVGFSHNFHATDLIEEWSRRDGDVVDTVTQRESLSALSDPFISAALKSLKPSFSTHILVAMGLGSWENHLIPSARRRSIALNKAVDEVVKNARRQKDYKDNKNNSLLQLMVEAKDAEVSTSKHPRTLSDIELRDETKTFLFAGHETSATWCYWACYALVNHPDIQEKVLRDVIKHAGSSKEITLETVDKMEYFGAFMQEVLRLYAPIGLIVRHNARKERLGGYVVPPKTRLVIPVHLLHRHPRYWDDPESFQPERWLDRTEEFQDRIRFAFLPFSAGGRNCIGQRFAAMEAKLIMAPLIRAFRLEIAPSQREVEFTFTSFISVKSTPSLRIVAKSRD